MKNKRNTKKLFLNKKTIAHLHHKEMKVVKGGLTANECISCYIPCYFTGRSVCFCAMTDGCASN